MSRRGWGGGVAWNEPQGLGSWGWRGLIWTEKMQMRRGRVGERCRRNGPKRWEVDLWTETRRSSDAALILRGGGSERGEVES